ncbi:hypothetical protein PanWU01x14_367650, partial [Parasponia andersonii]
SVIPFSLIGKFFSGLTRCLVDILEVYCSETTAGFPRLHMHDGAFAIVTIVIAGSKDE